MDFEEIHICCSRDCLLAVMPVSKVLLKQFKNWWHFKNVLLSVYSFCMLEQWLQILPNPYHV